MEFTPEEAADVVQNGGTYWRRLRNCVAPRNTTDDRYIPIAAGVAVHAILGAGGLLGPLLHVVASLSWEEQVLILSAYRWSVKDGPDYYIKACNYLSRGLVLRLATRIEARQGYDAAQRFLTLNSEPA